MDIETLVDVLTANEREELLERLTTPAESTDNETDDSQDASGCCGGARSKARRRPVRTEMRKACCAG